ncbi:hypothetical protein P389DRAFT_166985 [Cystobasidium minutum MCA 4210]|uniref:uncharacterized protein n=1 Tax=Cystobasidium minutum MCA 4210 TaxID=1397322 RepID=UPI0034CE7A7E|eukprot:jgi/Rhomi1/166985/fgenesh1_kg.2_\
MASTGGRRVVKDRSTSRVRVKDEEEDEKQDLWHFTTPSQTYPHARSYAGLIKEDHPQKSLNQYQLPVCPARASPVRTGRDRKEEVYEDPFTARQKPVHYAELGPYQRTSRASSISPEWDSRALDVENVNRQLTDAQAEIERLELERDDERDKRLRAERRLQRITKDQEAKVERLVAQRAAQQTSQMQEQLDKRDANLSWLRSKVTLNDAAMVILKEQVRSKDAAMEILEKKYAKSLDMLERQELRHRREMEQGVPPRPSSHRVVHHQADLKQTGCPSEALMAIAESFYSRPTDLKPDKSVASPKQVPTIHIDDSPVLKFHKPATMSAVAAPDLRKSSSSTSSCYETASTGTQTTIVNDWLSCCSDVDATSPSPVFVGSPDWNASGTLKYCLNRDNNGRLGLGLVV